MADVPDEVEIKIEYNESFETDPLCAVTEEFTENHFMKNTQVEVDGPFFKENSLMQKHDTEDIDDFSYSDYNGDDDRDMIRKKEPTWYKEIDISGRFLCRFCDLNYTTVQTLRHHIKIKHPDYERQLKNHILKNKRNSKLKCHICKARFKILLELKDHVKLKHNLETIKTSCTYCGATFQNQKLMLEHLFQKHKVVKNFLFSCDTCGYRNLKRSHFNQHRNTHLTEKDMKCNNCDYSTNYLPNLKIHERIHTNDRPYVCDKEGCVYSCTAKSALRSHQLKHNREQNMLYCDKCSYSTVYKQSLKKHTECHYRNSIKIKL